MAFKLGDIVLLRSGGPAMTVYLMREDHAGETIYDTIWFDDRELKRDSFSGAELIGVEKNDPGYSRT